MNTETLTTSQSDILLRSIENNGGEPLTPEAAKFLLSWHLAEEDIARMNELAVKAGRGTLTPAEEKSLSEYQRSVNFLDYLKLKARLQLRKNP